MLPKKIEAASQAYAFSEKVTSEYKKRDGMY